MVEFEGIRLRSLFPDVNPRSPRGQHPDALATSKPM
jgi:hypothetical protein